MVEVIYVILSVFYLDTGLITVFLNSYLFLISLQRDMPKNVQGIYFKYQDVLIAIKRYVKGRDFQEIPRFPLHRYHCLFQRSDRYIFSALQDTREQDTSPLQEHQLDLLARLGYIQGVFWDTFILNKKLSDMSDLSLNPPLNFRKI